jgi:sulfur relay (sulfurtransferase) DsrC/TusE family protein
MTQKQIAEVKIDVDEEGYMTNHTQWSREVAAALAKEEGIGLTAPFFVIVSLGSLPIEERIKGLTVSEC